MNKNLKIVFYGFLVWLIPFVVSILIYPLKISTTPFFESIMPVVLTITAVVFSYLYLKNIDMNFIKEGVIIGLAWLIISIAIDLPMFMWGPMQMTFTAYMMDIGTTYLIIPAITIGFGYLAEIKAL